MANLNECRGFAASVTFKDNGRDGEEVFLLTGGYVGNYLTSTVEAFDGDSWDIDRFDQFPIF